jgi:ABC-type multidrug transport system fused ATPase/permease subunit
MSSVAIAPEARPRSRTAVGRLLGSLGPVADLLRPYRAWVWGAIGVNVGIHAFTIASAAAGATLVGRAVTGATAEELRGLIWIVVALVIPIAILGWLDMLVTHVMSFRLLHDLRIVLYERFRRLAPAYLLDRRSGDIARTSMADVELLELFTSHMAPPMVAALVVPLLVLIALAAIHPLLAMVFLPFAIAVASVPAWLLAKAQAQGDELREELGALGANVVDAVQGTREVLAAGATEVVLDRIRRQHRRIFRTSVAHGRRSGIERASTDALVALAAIAMLATAAALVLAGSMPAARFPVAIVLAIGGFAPLIAISGTFREVGQVSAAADRIQELLAAEPSVTDLVDRPPAGPIDPDVVFRDVCFAYGPDLPEVLHGASFEVAPGETVALVGRSGAGKSTLANLLLRLWDVGDGDVSIGGHDVRSFPQRDLRALMAVVPQDVYLFHTTVRENIRLGRPDATDLEIERAAELAQARGFIEALPDGWETELGERGATISGGQRQRLAIARALLRDAPILVMDEAVSNLDAESERAMHAALMEVAVDRTTLLIAHRPSTIRLADRVVVVQDGTIAEVGTYDQLLARGGAFTALLSEAGPVIG